MDKERKSIAEFVKEYDEGKFNNGDRDVQIDAGWFDWFCHDSSLCSKTSQLGNFVKRIADSKKFNKSKDYVFFKNNCPMVGRLYDSMSICSLEKDHKVLYHIGFLHDGCYGVSGSRVEITWWKSDGQHSVTFKTKREAVKWFLS